MSKSGKKFAAPKKESLTVDFDEETQFWCVFDSKGRAISSWFTREEAERSAIALGIF